MTFSTSKIGDVSEWEKFSAAESQSSSSVSSSSSSKSEFFEFFSEEWRKPASPEKIIFCGKLIIPPKDDPVPENKNKRGNLTGTRRRRSSRKDDCDGEGAELSNKDLALRESAEPPSSSPLLRSRWFLFLFGMDGRFPKQMDLKDMKNRQSRKAAPSSPRAGNRLRWMIRALSCGDSDGQVHAQAIVKASIAFAV
nr:hypothetical protein A4A49_09624 [Ipomoea trifida]